MTDYKCRQCGKELSWNGLYCSPECGYKARTGIKNVTAAGDTASESENRDTTYDTNERCCDQCGKEFNRWDRSDKRFCNATCRKRWNRAKREAEKILSEISFQTNKVYMTLKRKPHSRTPEALAEIKRLRGELDYMLRMYDAQTMKERADRDELVSGQRRKRDLRP